MTPDTRFLIGFAEGTGLMLVVFVVSDWIGARKSKRKEKEQSK